MKKDKKHIPIKLEDIQKENIFLVPANYFDQLPENIQLRLKRSLLSSPALKQNIHTVPENYFETLPNHIEKKIQTPELSENLKETIFEIPENYFDQLSSTIQQKIQKRPSVWEVDWFGITPRYKLALAYSIPLILILTLIYFIVGNENNDTIQIANTPNAETLFTQLEKKDISEYLAYQDHEEHILFDVAVKHEKTNDFIKQYNLPNNVTKKDIQKSIENKQVKEKHEPLIQEKILPEDIDLDDIDLEDLI